MVVLGFPVHLPERVLRPSFAHPRMDDVQFPDPFDPVTDADAARKAVRKKAEVRRIGTETIRGIVVRLSPGALLRSVVPDGKIVKLGMRILDRQTTINQSGIDLYRFPEQLDDFIDGVITQSDIERLVPHPLRLERKDAEQGGKEKDGVLHNAYVKHLPFLQESCGFVFSLSD